MKRFGLILLLSFFILSPFQALEGGERVLTVAAASDLTFALREIGKEFEKNTGIKVIFSFGSTGRLYQQIEHGAPFDLFFSASRAYVDRLERKGLILKDTRRVYAVGRIVLAASRKRGIRIKGLKDLLRPEVRRVAIANPSHAPYGMAAKEALISAGLWGRLKEKLVYGENIRQTLQFIETGNAEAGIVALSIADVPDVVYTPIDPSLHNPIEQVVAVLKGTDRVREARAFIDFVTGPSGRAVMERYGFTVPSS